MSTIVDNTFGKREHLCKHTLIDQLFGGNAHVVTSWPLKMVFLLVDKSSDQDVPVQLLFSVSKRSFKRAVKRNRVKRQIREAYRANKQQLLDLVGAMAGKQLLMAIVWQDAKLHDSAEIEAKLQKGLHKVMDRL